MKVILNEEVQGKGGEGDVIDVARGFAVNYLLPRGIAVEATKGNLKQIEQRRHKIEKRELARTTDAQAIKEAIDGKTINVPVRVGDEGQLFGSVTAQQVAAMIAEQLGPTIDRKRIVIRRAIKTAGKHDIEINIYREVKATVTINVYDENGSPDDNEEVAEAAEGETAETAETAAAADEATEAPAEGEQAAEAPAEE